RSRRAPLGHCLGQPDGRPPVEQKPVRSGRRDHVAERYQPLQRRHRGPPGLARGRLGEPREALEPRAHRPRGGRPAGPPRRPPAPPPPARPPRPPPPPPPP